MQGLVILWHYCVFSPYSFDKNKKNFSKIPAEFNTGTWFKNFNDYH